MDRISQKDLEDFAIPNSFEFIEQKSKDAFKNLVKTKATIHAFEKLHKKKKTHSKMDNLEYKKHKIQDYLISDQISNEQKRITFKYRTRMAEFGENFRAGKEHVVCPVCHDHFDNQDLSTQCPIIKNELDLTGNIKDIYKDKIGKEVVETASRVLEVRKMFINNA